MSARWNFGLGLLVATTACGGTDVGAVDYGGGHPGDGKPEGGEIRHENVRILGMPVQTWVMVYQYKGPTLADTAPFATPDPKAGFGNCVDERNTAPTWPFHAITGATYLNLPKVALSGPGITGSLNIVETNPPNKVGNSTFRAYDFTYGGGAPGDIKGFNASMTTAAMSQADSDYTLDIGDGKPMTYHMPAEFKAPLGIGGAAIVQIPAGQDLEYSWDAPKNNKGSSGEEHLRDTYFNFTFFADPTAASPPQFICFPDKDGHQLVPKSVIDALPAAGLMVNADLGHYMEVRDVEGDQRRFDLVSIFCNISMYQKQ